MKKLLTSHELLTIKNPGIYDQSTTLLLAISKNLGIEKELEDLLSKHIREISIYELKIFVASFQKFLKLLVNTRQEKRVAIVKNVLENIDDFRNRINEGCSVVVEDAELLLEDRKERLKVIEQEIDAITRETETIKQKTEAMQQETVATVAKCQKQERELAALRTLVRLQATSSGTQESAIETHTDDKTSSEKSEVSLSKLSRVLPSHFNPII